jgi:predicted RNA-binding Zn-ribbon protein involved in translation (DUF1610 family)
MTCDRKRVPSYERCEGAPQTVTCPDCGWTITRCERHLPRPAQALATHRARQHGVAGVTHGHYARNRANEAARLALLQRPKAGALAPCPRCGVPVFARDVADHATRCRMELELLLAAERASETEAA